MRYNPIIYSIVLLFVTCFSNKNIFVQESMVVNNLNDSLLFQIVDLKEPVIKEMISEQKAWGYVDGEPGYILSKDGVHWSNAHFEKYQPAIKNWWTGTRTPLFLIREEPETDTTFYTAFTGGNYSDFEKNSGFASVGIARSK